jgi:D-beta-D-heptose 7-phosphate kinase/D-beta-D-heptose 1-phosphate adenosyltransferase
MLDEYVWGDVGRVSPDAPVAVVDVRRRTRAPGGAANVALNLAAAGAEVLLAGIVGTDAAGEALRAALLERGLTDAAIADAPGRRTTTKTRVVARGQQLVRLDEEDRQPLDPALRARLLATVLPRLAGAGAVVVSDYAKGVVDREVVGAIGAASRRLSPAVPVIVDPKAKDLGVYRGCDALTPNRQEAEASSGVPVASDADVALAASRIHEASGATLVLVTRGDRGLSLWRAPGEVTHVPTRAREVYDVTGAGDTVLAYFALALSAGAAPDEAARLANAAAGVAVSRVGTTTVAPEDVFRALDAGSGSGKILDRRQARDVLGRERSRGRRIVFTNGCFDLLHAGHVALLEQARAKGDLLVVAVNSDASVRRLKGPERPLVSEADRTRVLAALDAVGLVVVFDEDTPLPLIEAFRPDVLVKGGDYTEDRIVGAELVRSYGGRVETIPLVSGRSTTALLDSIRNAERAPREPEASRE